MNGAHMKSLRRCRRQDTQFLFWPAVIRLASEIGAGGSGDLFEWNRNTEPFLESGIERPPLRGPNVPALAGTGKRSETMRLRQVIGGMIQLKTLLISPPRRQILHVPAQLIGIHQAPGRG